MEGVGEKNKEHSMRVFVSEKERARLLLKREGEWAREGERGRGSIKSKKGRVRACGRERESSLRWCVTVRLAGTLICHWPGCLQHIRPVSQQPQIWNKMASCTENAAASGQCHLPISPQAAWVQKERVREREHGEECMDTLKIIELYYWITWDYESIF